MIINFKCGKKLREKEFETKYFTSNMISFGNILRFYEIFQDSLGFFEILQDSSGCLKGFSEVH